MATNTYVALDKVTVGTATTSVTISGIPATYTDLVAVIQSTTSSPAPSTSLQFNGDTTSNYSHTYLTGDGSSASSGRNSTDRALVAYNGTVGSNPNTVVVNIMNYANTTTYKTFLSRASNATYGTDAVVGMWRKTPEAINSITFLTGTTGFAAGSTFSLYGIAAASVGAKATGGTIYSDDQYYYHVFGSTGTFTPLQSLSADVFTLAAGGGAGGELGGGGGAGGLLYNGSQSLTTTGYTCTVGAGGAGGSGANSQGTQGSNSSFIGGALSITATGGGYGGSGGTGASGTGGNGGSGGGSGTRNSFTASGGTGTSGQGNNGGNTTNTSSYSYPDIGAGGGGGVTAVGGNNNVGTGGIGGAGTSTYSSWGIATGTGQNVSGVYYYGGGGGGGAGSANGVAGIGGGGTGYGSTTTGGAGTPGLATTGGGGGGGGGNPGSGGAGGSGLVIVRYAK